MSGIIRAVTSGETRRERLATAGRWLVKQRSLIGRYATAAEFARALGTSAANVSNYETGKAEVSDDMAERIAEVLGLPILDVRRGLRLWVPPRGEPVQPNSLVGLPMATVKALVGELPVDQQDQLMAWLLSSRASNS